MLDSNYLDKQVDKGKQNINSRDAQRNYVAN